MTILGRVVQWKEWGIEYQADPRHRQLIMEFFGFDDSMQALQNNGGKEEEEVRSTKTAWSEDGRNSP